MPKSQTASNARWNELVLDLASRREELMDVFIGQLSQISSYSQGLVPREDVLVVSENSISVLIEALSGDSDADLSTHARTLGRRRARQGIPADHLIDAVRLNFGVIWSFMLDSADEEDLPVLARHVDRLANVVDDYARQVQEGFLTERALMALQAKSDQQQYIAALFAPDAGVTGRLEQIALSLGLKADGDYAVCAAVGLNSRRLQQAADHLTRRDIPMFTHYYEMGTIAFWPVTGDPERSKACPQHAAVKDLPCGLVDSTHGLATVPQAAAHAMRISEVLKPGDTGPTTVEDAWARLARRHLDDEIDFSTRMLGGFDDCPAHEQERLTEVVLTYLRSGSISAAAESLYCHRNTAQNWLNRFQALTGLDVSKPIDAALAYVALA